MPDIDKEQLYGRYQKHEDRRLDLATKIAHKALDIPEDDMNIDSSRHGIGTAGLLGAILGTGGLTAAGMFLGMFLNRNDTLPVPVAPQQPAAVPPAVQPKGQEWIIRWKIERDGKVTTWQEAVQPAASP